MIPDGPHEQHLRAVRCQLDWRPDVDDIIDELADHLECAAERLLAGGADPLVAERDSVSAVGSTDLITGAFLDEGSGRRARPSHLSRLGGLALLIAGPLWAMIGVVWVLSFYRPATWLGTIGSAVAGPAALTVVITLTVVGCTGWAVRIATPLTWRARAGLIATAAALCVQALDPDAAVLWAGFLGVGTAMLAQAQRRSVTTLEFPDGSQLALRFWYLATIPLQLALVRFAPEVMDAAPLGWAAAFAALGVALTRSGRAMAGERVPRPVSRPLALQV